MTKLKDTFEVRPSHPSLRHKKIGGGAWYPVAGVLGESTERLLKFPPSAHKYRAYGTNTCNFLTFKFGSTMEFKSTLKIETLVRLPRPLDS